MLKKAFPILALSVFSAMLGAGIILPLLPIYAEQMGATGIWVGIIYGGFFIARITVMPIVGRLSDRKGRKSYLAIGLLAFALVSLAYIPASSVLQLSIVRFIHGATTGLILPLAQAYVGDISPEGEEGKWMGFFNAAFFTGFGTGPLIGGLLTEHFSMTVAFSTMSVLNFVAFLGVLFFLPAVKPRLAASSSLAFGKMRDSDTIRGLFTLRLSLSLGRGAFTSFLPIFAALSLGLSTASVGVLLATNILLASLIQGLTGSIADRFSRRAVAILGSVVNLVFLALIPLTDSFWPLLGICVLGGFSVALFMPAISAIMIDEGRKFGMGATTALVTIAMSIGMAIGPLVGGTIADLANVNSAFYFAAGIVLIGTGLFAWFTR